MRLINASCHKSIYEGLSDIEIIHNTSYWEELKLTHLKQENIRQAWIWAVLAFQNLLEFESKSMIIIVTHGFVVEILSDHFNSIKGVADYCGISSIKQVEGTVHSLHNFDYAWK